jgi:hypothetical protein
MATRGPLSRGKRERERARVERQKQKAARREETKVRRNQTGSRPGGEDPDIAGIVPGPQANPWGDEPDAEAGEGEESDEP